MGGAARPFSPATATIHRPAPAAVPGPFRASSSLGLRKGVNSLPGRLAEFDGCLEALPPSDPPFAVTPGAWTPARAKLAHTAFLARNEEAGRATFYTDPSSADAVRRRQGHWLGAIDGSFLFLPESQEVYGRRWTVETFLRGAQGPSGSRTLQGARAWRRCDRTSFRACSCRT